MKLKEGVIMGEKLLDSDVVLGFDKNWGVAVGARSHFRPGVADS